MRAHDFERKMIGAIMLRPAIIDELSALCRPEDCTSDTWGAMYSEILQLHATGATIDSLSVAMAARKRGFVNAGAELARAMSEVASSEEAITAARQVRQASVMRAVLETAVMLTREARDETTDPFELLRIAEARLGELSRRQAPGRARRIGDLLPDVVAYITRAAEAYQRGEMVQGVPTGFTSLDRRTGGLMGTDLTILAARPGMGKTSMAMQLAKAAATAGFPALFVSLEMKDRPLIARLMASASSIAVTDILRGRIEPVQVQHLAGRIAAEMGHLPILIDDSDSTDLHQIETRIRRYVREDGVKVVFVDYVQLIKARAQNRANEVDVITRSLKNLAKSLDVPIVLLSQLNRQLENRPSKRPNLSDLKESGGIEEAADAVWFLYRPHYYDKNDDHWDAKTGTERPKDYSELIVAKFRNGETGTEELSWDGARTQFLDPFIASEMNHTPNGWEPAEEAF